MENDLRKRRQLFNTIWQAYESGSSVQTSESVQRNKSFSPYDPNSNYTYEIIVDEVGQTILKVRMDFKGLESCLKKLVGEWTIVDLLGQDSLYCKEVYGTTR